jgi:DNA-binding IscR family transcriptional regulator
MNPEDAEVKRSRVAMSILAYLNENPEAQDSLEGILRWWLLDRMIEEQMALVESALARLVAAGLVTEVAGRDGGKRFKLDRSQESRVRELLAEAVRG